MKYIVQALLRKSGHLIAALLFGIVVGLFSEAKASETYPPVITYKATGYDGLNNSTGYFSTTTAACEAYRASHNAPSYTITIQSQSSTECGLKFVQTDNPSNIEYYNAHITDRQMCTHNNELLVPPATTCTDTGLTCSGTDTYNSTTNTCDASEEDECEPLTGLLIPAHTYSATSDPPSTVCKNNCRATMTSLSLCVVPTGGSTSPNCFGKYKFNGESCTPNNASDATTPQHDCIAKGMTYGTVNGVVVCAKAGTVGTPDVKQASVSNQTITNNTTSTSTSTTTTTTSNTATGQTQSTTTGTDAEGNPVDQTIEQDTASFCEQNPNHKMCQPSNDICEKDPNIPACKAWCDKPENEDKIACMTIGDDLTDTKEDLGTSEVDFNIAPIGGIPSMSGCPAPETVTIGMATIPISYEWLCTYAAAFKFLVLIFSWIGAAYIVYNASIKD